MALSSQEIIEIQTKNYWYASQRLANKNTPQTDRDHAVAILKAQAECKTLGDLSTIARVTLENNNVDFTPPEMTLWSGTRP